MTHSMLSLPAMHFSQTSLSEHSDRKLKVCLQLLVEALGHNTDRVLRRECHMVHKRIPGNGCKHINRTPLTTEFILIHLLKAVVHIAVTRDTFEVRHRVCTVCRVSRTRHVHEFENSDERFKGVIVHSCFTPLSPVCATQSATSLVVTDSSTTTFNYYNTTITTEVQAACCFTPPRHAPTRTLRRMPGPRRGR